MAGGRGRPRCLSARTPRCCSLSPPRPSCPGQTRAMTDHKTGTREEWLTARLELLDAEKELTRRSDELARRRQELPWYRIDKQYRFDTDQRPASPPPLPIDR